MRVAVVIPCHDVQEHLAAALASVLAQTHADLDVLLVDDGSTDGTPQLIADLHQRHPGRFRSMRQENRGAAAARNAGLRATQGEYVQFLDADDVIYPDKIAAQLAVAAAHAHPDLVVGDFEQIMPNGLLLPSLARYDRPWMALITTRMGTTSANLWKRSAVEAVGGWNEALASSQDYELMFRLLKNRATVAWDAVIRTDVLKRASGSISRTDVDANWLRYVQLRQEMKVFLAQQDPVGHAAEIEALRQYIFMALRIIAVRDLPLAVRLYRSCIGKPFKPQVGKAITERYVLLHTLLGFAATERLLRRVKRGTPEKS